MFTFNNNNRRQIANPPSYGPSIPVQSGYWHNQGIGGPGSAAQRSAQQLESNQQDWFNRHNVSGRSPFDRQQVGRPRRRANQSGVMLRPGINYQIGGGRQLNPLAASRRRMINHMAGQALMGTSMRSAQKPFMGRGLSLDEGTQASAIPTVARALNQANLASRAQPLADYLQDSAYGLQQRQIRNQALQPLYDMI